MIDLGPLSVSNPQRAVIEGPVLLHGLITNNKQNSNVAIDFLGQKGERSIISYTSLHRLTDRLAQKIRAKTILSRESNVVIPVIIPQSPELYIAWISVLKAGAAFCPILPDTPSDRLHFILKDVAATLVLTCSELNNDLHNDNVDADILTISLSDLQTEINVGNPADGEVLQSLNVSTDSPAYVMYTSGSTGLPKGVLVSHRSATQSLLAHHQHIPPFKRFLQFASPTFDVSVFEVFFPLFRGATVASCHREQMLEDLPATITRLNVDAAELTPTVAGTLLRSRNSAPSLQLLLTIGEMLTKSVVDEFGGNTDRASVLFAMYGPTECAIHCTIAPRLSSASPVQSIGHPLSTVTAFILKSISNHNEVVPRILPVGQTGELAIAGQLASGYLNRSEQTAAAFVDLPGYGLVYRTGDRARMLPDGQLEIFGRISSGQVKIRGQRIELGEIENAINRIPEVRFAIASVLEDVIVAFCVTIHQNVSRKEVYSACKRWLPTFMRPGEVILLGNNVPRLPSGKIDRRKLEADYLYQKDSKVDHSSDADLDQVEAYLLAAVKEQFHDQILLHSSLWTLGLNSLQAIQLASKLRERFPDINVHSIMEAECIADLAKSLPPSQIPEKNTIFSRNSSMQRNFSFKPPDLARFLSVDDLRSVTGVSPCSPLQTAMLAETYVDGKLYFNTVELALVPSVSFEDFHAAFREVATANDVLRSGFVHLGNDELPFVRVVWSSLDSSHQMSLLHPLKINFVENGVQRVAKINIHHALYDGWSWELIIHDINAILSGEIAPSRPDFLSFVEEQRNILVKEDETIQHYWRDALSNLQLTKMPILCTSRSPLREKRAVLYPLEGVRDNLSSTAHTLHISQQTIISAAWSILLGSYTGSQDVVFGYVSSGRTLPIPGIESIIGPCITTMPLRIDMSLVKTTGDLLIYLNRLQRNIQKFESMSLREVKKMSGLGGREEMFDSILVWQETPLSSQKYTQHVKTINSMDFLSYTLVLEAEPLRKDIILRLCHDTSVIPNEHAEHILRQLDHLITVLVGDPRMPLTEIWKDCSGKDLSVQNSNIRTFDGSFTLISTIERLSYKSPHATAVEFVIDFEPLSGKLEVDKMSYLDLYERSKTISQILVSRFDISPDDIVCILMEKSLDLYVAILATILAGASYMCIDSRTPSKRAKEILRQANSHLVISNGSRDLQLGNDFQTEIFLLGENTLQTEKLKTTPKAEAAPSDLAYAVFTSGSTGIPKGVLITRKNLLSNIDSLSRLYPCVSGSDRLLQACSQAFDVSVFEIFWTWHMGLTLCSATNDILFRDLEKLISALSVTHLSLTPSVAALVNPQAVPGVKFVVTAGEPMNSKVYRDWADKGLFQGYGPSETTNICNVRTRVSRDVYPNNVGLPLPNTSIFVCSPGAYHGVLNLVPKGGVGEIWVGGDQVGRGYIDPALTSASFHNHSQYGRLYQSGDFGRLLADGSLAILGRKDDQVKLRGQRIETGDINAALVRIPFVKDAFTFVHGKAAATTRLVSCFTFLKDSSTKSENVHSFVFSTLEEHLPIYMVPDIIVPMSTMPLTKQGKIDAKALVEMYAALEESGLQRFSRNGDQENVESLSEQGLLIAKALAEVSGASIQSIGRNTSFFALGIDSLSCIHLSKRLRELGLGQVDVSTVLRNSTIERLERSLTASLSLTNVGLVPSRHKLESLFSEPWRKNIQITYQDIGHIVEKILPCTPLQEAMISNKNAENATSYQNQLCFQVNGDISILKHAWVNMVSRHQLLRTGFSITESAQYPYAQVVLANYELPWFENTAEASPAGPFEDLMIPPYRLVLQTDRKRSSSKLTLLIHHVLYDAEAMNLLLRDVEHSYLGRPISHAVKFDRYLDYMVNQNVEKVEKFWKNEMIEAPKMLLGGILSQGTGFVNDSKQDTLHLISKVRLTNIQEATQRYSTTVASLIQASWARLLSLYFGTGDICYGNVFSGRNLPIDGVETVVGPCFNTLPVRVRIGKRDSNEDLVRAVHASNIEITSFQPTSLRQIQRLLGQNEDLPFDTLVLLQKEAVSLDEQLWKLDHEDGKMAFPFILEVIPKLLENELLLLLHCHAIGIETGNRILSNFDELLQHMVHYPRAQASDFGLSQFEVPDLKPRIPPIKQNKKPHQEVPGLSSIGWSETELKIRKILSDLSVTDSSKISRDTSIFQLGLDSINAFQIASKLRQINFEINGGDVLEAPTVEELALLCDKQKGVSSSLNLFDFDGFDHRHRKTLCARLNMLEEEVEIIRPCTPTQSGILSQFIKSNGELYFNTISLTLENGVDSDRIRQSWVKATARHELLRTGFTQLDNKNHPFVMVTYPPRQKELPWIENQSLSQDLQDLEIGQKVLNNLHLPPWQISVARLASNWILKISILHSLYDAQSLDRILADVGAFYCGHELGPQPSISSPLSAILQQIKSAQEEDAKAFWVNTGELLHPTKFPDLKIHQIKSHQILTETLKCSVHADDIANGCRALGVSLQTVCQYAWAKLLAAYTGQSSICFGLVLSGRTFGNENAGHDVFPHVNTVPFGIEVTEDGNGMLKKLSKLNAGLAKYQFTPFSTVKRWLQVEGELYDSVLVLQKFETVQSRDIPWIVTDDTAKAEYAVSVEIVPSLDGSLDLNLIFREDFIPKPQALIILRQVDELLMQALLPQVKHQISADLLSTVSAKNGRFDTSTHFLHELFESTASRVPEKKAFEFVTGIEDNITSVKTWTYKDLDDESNKIANLLLQHQALPGDLVGLCFDKCPEASFSMLGILKAGCAYVAIDPNTPPTRAAFILEDAKCKILLTTQEQATVFKDVSADLVLVVDDTSFLQNLPITKPTLSRDLRPDDTCYCLYTSGTTGTPKGCLISHDSAVQAMLSFRHIFDGRWDSYSRWLQFASFHFDVSVLEHFWSWSVGICVTSAPRDLLFEDLPGAIRALQITHLDLTPSLARLLTPEDVPSLCGGVFIVGGEQVRQDILDVWGDVGCLYNFYGPSEVTIGCTVHKQVSKSAKSTNIGQQWDNVGSFVLEPNTSKPVLRGAIGELCLSGPLVGKGYLNRADLTSEKFVAIQPYNTRVYRTGDLVRLLHDSSFEFLGRIDDQIKLRGQRLEIGEINHIIHGTSEEIKDVATMVLKLPNQTKDQLVSFFSTQTSTSRPKISVVRLDDKNKDLSARIRKQCSKKLPAYMVPTYILSISVMPLSANNKVDLKAIRKVLEDASEEEIWLHNTADTQSFGAEWSRNLTKLIEILSSFLQVPMASIRPTSRLFELGLDSISAISLSGKLRRAGFDGAHPAVVMRNQNVQDLTHALIVAESDNQEKNILESRALIATFSQDHKTKIAEVLGVSSVNIESIAPCTPLQKGMIARSLLHADEAAYFSAFEFELSASVDANNLRAAWDRTTREVQILRTRFVDTIDGYAQVVLTSDCVHAEIRNDRDKQTNDSNEAAEEELLQKWIRFGQGLGRKPGWEVNFVRRGHQNVMTLHMFHGLYDGISLPLLLDKVAYRYLGSAYAKKAPEYHSVLPYGVVHSATGAREFWTSRPTLNSRLDLPEKYSSDAMRSAAIHKVEYLEASQLDSVRRSLDVTWPAIFHAAWLLVLEEHFKTIPTIGVVVSGRALPIAGIEDVIGPLFNTLPGSINGLPKRSTWHDLIRACHSFNIDSIPFQHTSLSDISKWTGNGVNELFDSLFVFQKKVDAKLAMDSLWEATTSESMPVYPLALEIEQYGGDANFSITFVSQRSRLQATDLEELAETLKKTLDQIVSNAEVNLIPDAFTQLQEKQPRLKENESIHGTNIPAGGQRDLDSNKLNLRPFVWSERAIYLRSHLAGLSGLDPESISPDRTIFELGLDSIDAITLASRLRADSIVTIGVKGIMKNPSIRQMLEYLSTIQPQNTALEAQRKSRLDIQVIKENLRALVVAQGTNLSDVQSVLPVSPMQEGILANFRQYYNFELLSLEPDIDVSRLQQALQVVFKHHPVFRTHFVEIEDPREDFTFAQIVTNDWRINFAVMDSVEDLDLDLVVEGKLKFVESNLLGYPTVDVSLIPARNNLTRSSLLLGMTHAVYDAWSMELFHQEVARAYAGLQLSPDRSCAEHLQEVYAARDTNREFWRREIVSSRRSIFQRQTQNMQQNSSPPLVKLTSSKSASAVRKFCRDLGITVQSLGLACWALTLAQHLRQLEVCFGVVLSGRTSPGSDKLIFPTFNTVVFQMGVHEDLTVRDLLHKVHDRSLDVGEHQHFPLRESLKFAGNAADKNPEGDLFNSLFVYQKAVPGDDGVRKLWHADDGKTGKSTEHSTPAYPVNIEMEVKDVHLIWTAVCQVGVMDQDDLEEVTLGLDGIICCLMEFPNRIVLERHSNGLASICSGPWIEMKEAVKGKSKKNEQNPRPGHAHANENKTEGLHSLRHPRADATTSSSSWSETETAIREVLAAVAKVDVAIITKSTNLFHLGLDSVSAIKVSTWLMKKKGVRLPVSEMLKALTVERMAVAVLKAKADRTQTAPTQSGLKKDKLSALQDEKFWKCLSISGIDQQDVESVVPAHGGQEYMLGMWQSSGGELFYPEFRYMAYGKTLSSERLLQHWETLRSKLPVLRTLFVNLEPQNRPEQGDRTLQVIVNAQQTAKYRDRLPYRLRSFDRDDGVELFLRIHHALYDAVSLPAIMKALEKLCNGQNVGVQPSVSTFVYSTRDVSTLDERKSFWTEHLSIRQRYRQSPKLTKEEVLVRTAMAESGSQRAEIFRQNFLSESHLSALKDKLLSSGVTPQALFFAAVGQVYADFLRADGNKGASGDEQAEYVVLGIYLANRHFDLYDSASATLTNPTLNIVPLRIRVLSNPLTTKGPVLDPLIAVAREVQTDLASIGTKEHCGVSLREIWEWTGVQVECCVNFLSLPEVEEEEEEEDDDDNDEPRYDTETENGVEGSDGDLKEPNDTRALGQGFGEESIRFSNSQNHKRNSSHSAGGDLGIKIVSAPRLSSDLNLSTVEGVNKDDEPQNHIIPQFAVVKAETADGRTSSPSFSNNSNNSSAAPEPNPGPEWCLPTLDIEARIERSDGFDVSREIGVGRIHEAGSGLSVGMFAPRHQHFHFHFPLPCSSFDRDVENDNDNDRDNTPLNTLFDKLLSLLLL